MIVLQILAGAAAFLIVLVLIALIAQRVDHDLRDFWVALGWAFGLLMFVALICGGVLVGAVFLVHFAFTGEWSFQ